MMDYRFAERMGDISGNAIREIFKLLGDPEMISFAGGMPSAESFACEDLAQIANELLREKGRTILQYGATEGYYPLKEALVPFLEDKGVSAAPQDMLIITGSQQGIDLTLKAFIDPGDVVLVERPTYLAVLHILKTYQARAVGVNLQADGVDLNELEDKMRKYRPKLLYLVPTFQNPTGRTTSLEKRKAIGELAEKYSVAVFEDDPYRDLRYAGEPLPALYGLGNPENMIYSTSVSKLISPGLRVGVVVSPPEILRKQIIGKQATDVHTAILNQAMVAEFLKRGLLAQRLPAAIGQYRARLDTMLEAMREHFPQDAYYTVPQGGLFIWVELPEKIDTTKIFPRVVDAKVAYVPGEHFYCDGTGQNTLRLNFSASSPERIRRGIQALGAVLNDILGG